jgi:hypothetical protein
MSSSNVSLILSELSATRADVLALKSEVSSLRAALAAKTVSAPAVASGKPVAEKKQRKKSDAPPTAWRLFTDRVRGLLKDNAYSGKSVGVECVQFCSTLKDENSDLSSWADADILARRTDWSAPEVSKQKAAGKSWRKEKGSSAPASVVSGGEDEELDGDAPVASSTDGKKKRKNPWEGLTPEQRAAKSAAMKAGRDAKKAAASAESGDAPVTESAPVSPPPKASSSSTANAVSSAAVAVTSASASGPAGFKKVALNGERFWVNLESGHAYYRLPDESQGDWAGLFSKTPKPNVDKTAAEPAAEAEDDEFNIDE